MTSGLAPRSAASELRGLFGELNDLKRIRSAGRKGSIAERGFFCAWAALSAGKAPDEVMRAITASALAAARLGDLDRDKLVELGLSAEETDAILCRALDEFSVSVEPELFEQLRTNSKHALAGGGVPAFATLLAEQPRAGATCPGKARLVLEPAETHAEHSWAVAVMGVLLSPRYDADPAIVFLAGLSHHLHNAFVPDSGFTGEMLLGDHLQPICSAATARALDYIADPLRSQIIAARECLVDASTPEGRAFHAADVVDRVLQLAQHLRPGTLTMRALLDDWELVHAGLVKGFHDAVLAEMDLA